MLNAAICGLILIFIYKFIDRNRVPEEFDPVVDWWMAFALVFAPSILIALLSLGIAAAELPPYFVLALYPLYFLVPFLTLKFGLDFKNKRASIYSIWVLVVAISIEVIMYLLFSFLNKS